LKLLLGLKGNIMIHVKRAETKAQIIHIDGGEIEDTPIGQDKPNKGKFTRIETTEDFVEKVKDHGTVSSGTEQFKLNQGTYHIVTVGGDFTVAFTGWPDAGLVASFTLKLINAGAHTLSWPASVDWPGGTEPSWTAAGTDFALFMSGDNGTIVYGGRSWEDSK